MFPREPEMVALRAKRDFPHNKKMVKKGTEFQAENYEARGLIIAQLAERIKPGTDTNEPQDKKPQEEQGKDATYKRRDMRAENESTAETSRQVATKGTGRADRD